MQEKVTQARELIHTLRTMDSKEDLEAAVSIAENVLDSVHEDISKLSEK